jgi:hypothetical protein
MFKARTLEQAQQDYLLAISQAESPISLDLSQGSVVYTLSRGSAALATAQDLRLESIEKSYLTNATGQQLDSIGLSFGLARLQPSFSVGSVLAISLSETESLTQGFRLLEPKTGLEFIGTANSTVSVTGVTEVPITIRALSLGSRSNLVSGTEVFSTAFPDVRFIVGSARTNVYIGDLTGGSDSETDEQYRSRIGIWLSSRSSGSSSELVLKLLELDTVDRAFVKTTVGGVAEIWIDSLQTLTNLEVEELKTYVLGFMPAGIFPVVVQAKRVPLNFELVVEPLSGSRANLQTLTSTLNSVVRSFIDSLSVGDLLLRESLLQSLRPFVRSVSARNLARRTSPGTGNILVAGDIKITYPINV